MSIYLFIAIAVLQIGDIVTTVACIQSGKGQEANGLMAFLIKRLGLVPALVATKAAILSLLWYALPQMPIEILVAMVFLYVWVVINNAQVYYK